MTTIYYKINEVQKEYGFINILTTSIENKSISIATKCYKHFYENTLSNVVPQVIRVFDAITNKLILVFNMFFLVENIKQYRLVIEQGETGNKKNEYQ